MFSSRPQKSLFPTAIWFDQIGQGLRTHLIWDFLRPNSVSVPESSHLSYRLNSSRVRAGSRWECTRDMQQSRRDMHKSKLEAKNPEWVPISRKQSQILFAKFDRFSISLSPDERRMRHWMAWQAIWSVIVYIMWRWGQNRTWLNFQLWLRSIVPKWCRWVPVWSRAAWSSPEGCGIGEGQVSECPGAALSLGRIAKSCCQVPFPDFFLLTSLHGAPRQQQIGHSAS